MPTLKVKNAQIERLLKIGQERFGTEFGWKAKFARSLKMTPQQLNDYISGRISIGTEMQTRLRGINANVEWLLTGKDPGAMKERPEEEGRMLHLLKELGIDTEQKLKAFLNPQGIAQDVALVMRERMLKYRKKRGKQ